MTSSVSELIERVKAATGANYQTECDLRTAIDHRWPALIPPNYTASIDSALGLMGRVLPDWRYDLHSPRMGQTWEAVLMDGDSASRRIIVGHAATAPLAIVLALLTALQSLKENNHG